MAITAKEVLAAAPGMSTARQRLLLKKVDTDFDCLDMSGGPALFVWLGVLLYRKRTIDQDTQDLILDTFKEDITKYGQKLAEYITIERVADAIKVADAVEILSAYLTIADNRYVILTTNEHFLDLKDCLLKDGIRCLPLEIVSYSLGKLYATNLARIVTGRQRATGSK